MPDFQKPGRSYDGSGTLDDPFIVDFDPDDPENPMTWPSWRKWAITMITATSTLAVGFASSAYSGGISELLVKFNTTELIITLGVSLFVLGFAIGPLLWAPLSEMYGRRTIFLVSYPPFVAFGGACGGVQTLAGLLILRFLQGTFGASPLTNSGGIIADMFSANERGLAMAIFAAAPFLGPVLGPICGGFLGQTVGYQWIFYVMAIFGFVMLVMHVIFVPETYAPVLLERRALELSKNTGECYITKYQQGRPKTTASQRFKVAMTRPFVLLFLEPIVFLVSLYMAVIYGTLYLEFVAFPIVFQEDKGWSPGIGGLAFIPIGIGMGIAVCLVFYFNALYVKRAKKEGGIAPPEARLPMAMLGAVLLPIGLFWFAWTTYASVPWIVPLIATAPFGCGMVLLFLAISNYLIDAYLIHAASALAANSVLRSLFGFAFPLFGPIMYKRLGTQWAACVIAFLALLCVPIPFIFYKMGARIRGLSKHAPPDMYALQKRRQADLEATRVAEAEREADFDDGAKGNTPGQEVTDASRERIDGTTNVEKSG